MCKKLVNVKTMHTCCNDDSHYCVNWKIYWSMYCCECWKNNVL